MKILRTNTKLVLVVSMLIFGCIGKLKAQGHEISISIANAKDTLYQIGHHWGNTINPLGEYRMEKGYLLLSGSEELPPGLYYVRKPGFQFDFIVNEQQFALQLDALDPYKTLEIKNSYENELYKEFRLELDDFRQRSMGLSIKGGNAADSIQRMKDFVEANERMQAGLRQKARIRPELLASSIIMCVVNQEIPSFVSIIDPQEKIAKLRQHYIENYWLNIDLSNPDLLRTPFLYSKVMNYFDQVASQHPDDLIWNLDKFFDKTGKETFKFWLGTFLNHYHYSKSFGKEKVYLHIAENYFLAGRADWIALSSLEFLKEDLEYMKANLVGKEAPDLELIDRSLKVKQPLTEMRSKYTALFFYDPNCEHCIETAPLVNKEYENLSQLDVDLLSICTVNDKDQWDGFVNKFNLKGRHLMKTENDRLYKDYDIRSTPKIYLLNAEGTIIGRNLDITQLVSYVQYANSFER